jgi:hypothetical protein
MRAFIRLLAFVICLLPMLAEAQPYPPSPYLFLNQPNTWGAAQTFTGGMLFGTAAANATTQFGPLSKATNPILSPETQNNPTASALYMGAPLIQGWNDTPTTSGNGTYSQMITDNVTMPASGATHYGLEERTLNVLGTGSTSNELNVSKFFLTVGAGITSTALIEPLEASLFNNGTLSGAEHFEGSFTNSSTGTISNSFRQLDLNFANYNTTAGSLAGYVGVSCNPMAGSGSAVPNGFSFCIDNYDPTESISTLGPIVLRTTGTNPAVTACGTACPTQATTNSDMSGVVTEGTSATGFTLTFLIARPFAAPNCMVWPENGAAAQVYNGSGWTLTPSQTTLVVAHASATSPKFGYVCFNNY